MKRLCACVVLGVVLSGCGMRGQMVDASDDAYCQRAARDNPGRSYAQCRRDVATSRGEGATFKVENSRGQ